MPKPVTKSEQDLREHEIADHARAVINLTISTYRRRMLNAVPGIIGTYRAYIEDTGKLAPIDKQYRDTIEGILIAKAKELEG